MTEVDFLIKVRDGAQMIADAANEALEKLVPSEAKEYTWEPSKIQWNEAQGAKGPYQKSVPRADANYKNAIADLEAHKETLTRDGYFYWLFSDGATIGRKKR